ncbi:hypothetical protein SeH_A4061 [Salmonella enterica subsp. enterica serovar Hadar str. RI_05P066]|uniref:Uncharacterized protein n=5 Tax=Salmonella enterica I TaxID=59201 RepID=A0A6C8G389_SALIN|nr:hypothetical protein SeD_A3947 [Salmonella enterica subsp. enterica serovar Dublin str. CT_02021853]AET56232.1 heavy metal-transporting ATPase [Salmonella enterica subsp. enterica serovar Gallinarum/Pullorum str. RKS5078]AGS27290.1 hypothetical protein SN31241_3150 [Salmonella enterica subsp. enterica serovar Newport str. USMARC-S3124.1]AGU66732.1 heavy metal-transporting ATPase [Salmonella enterica subsp. enterica serovar Gallinarum/Pullorum str. CDC1983-67]AOC84657.1 hypothetical protein F
MPATAVETGALDAQCSSQQQLSAFCIAGANLKEVKGGTFLPSVSGVDITSSG